MQRPGEILAFNLAGVFDRGFRTVQEAVCGRSISMYDSILKRLASIAMSIEMEIQEHGDLSTGLFVAAWFMTKVVKKQTRRSNITLRRIYARFCASRLA